MTEAFGYLGTGQTTLTQPNPAGEHLIFRLSDSGDIDSQVTFSGLVGSVQTSEDVNTSSVDGRIEVQTLDAFKTLNQVTTIGAFASDLTVMGQGTAAQGRIDVASLPADGNAVRVTLSSLTDPQYRWSNPGRGVITALASSAITQGAYFDIGLIRFWFDKDGAGTSAPATPGGGVLVKVSIFTGDPANDTAVAIHAAMLSDVPTLIHSDVGTPGAPTVTYTMITLGAAALVDGASPTGFTLTQTAGGSSASNQVRTGWNADGTACTTADAATYLAAAINRTGTAGQDYGADISDANPYVSAAVTDSSVVLTDRLAVNRALGWNVVQTSGSSLAIVPMVGGVNGVTLVTIPAGSTTAYDPFTLETPDLSTATLPALLTPTCDAIQVGSAQCEVHIKMPVAGSAIEFQLDWTDDPSLSSWAVCSETSAAISINNKPTTAPYVLAITSVRPEFLRLRITSNPNSVALELDARVNFGG